MERYEDIIDDVSESESDLSSNDEEKEFQDKLLEKEEKLKKRKEQLDIACACSNAVENTLGEIERSINSFLQIRNEFMQKNKNKNAKASLAEEDVNECIAHRSILRNTELEKEREKETRKNSRVDKHSIEAEEEKLKQIDCVQGKNLSLLLMKIRRGNRAFCNLMDEINKGVEEQKIDVKNKRENLTHLQYQLAWFRKRIEEEDLYKTPVWDELRKHIVKEEEYVSKCSSEQIFVAKKDDLHKYTLNWLQHEMQERIRGKEELYNVKRQRQAADQKLQALKNQECEILNKLSALEKAVEDIYNICKTDHTEVVEFPSEARHLPGPLLNIFSKFFGYKHLISDPYLEIKVKENEGTLQELKESKNDDMKEKDAEHDIYEPYHSAICVELLKQPDMTLPLNSIASSLIPFPLTIKFQFLPHLDVIIVNCSLKETLQPRKNEAVLANLFNDDDDFGIYSPNPANYYNELGEEGEISLIKCEGGRAYRWAQSLACMKYGITLPYVKPIPEDVSVHEVIRRIRDRVSHRMWLIYQVQHFKIKPNSPPSCLRQSDFLHAIPASRCLINVFKESSFQELKSVTSLDSCIDNFEYQEMLYIKTSLQYNSVTLDAYIAIPLDGKSSIFRLVQTSIPEKGVDIEKDLPAHEAEIYAKQKNESLTRAESNVNTVCKLKSGSNAVINVINSNQNNTNVYITHDQSLELLELQNYINYKVVEKYESLNPKYYFTMFSIQMAFLKLGFEKYVDGAGVTEDDDNLCEEEDSNMVETAAAE